MSSDLLDAALTYAARGWPVLPCRPATKVPSTTHGCKDATTDTDVIRHWWGRWIPDGNVAIATGTISGLVVVDLDCKGDADGFANWAQLMADQSVAYAPTRCVVTPSGGLHLYFRHPGAGTRIGQRPLGPGVDVRADGGFVVAPPSVTATGRYELDVDAPLAPLPPPLLELLIRPAATVTEPVDDTDPYAELRRTLDAPTVGHSDAYVRAALEGEVQRVMDATPNVDRNIRLNEAAFRLGTLVGAGLLDEAEVYRALMAAADAVGLVADDGENACRATITSGLRAGVAKPRTAGR
jgi:hypothetical protein